MQENTYKVIILEELGKQIMASRSNFMADLTQMANGAASAFGSVREEIDSLVRQRMERTLNARGLVTREEFDALRTRHEALAARLALLESVCQSATESPANTTVKVKPTKKLKATPKKSRK